VFPGFLITLALAMQPDPAMLRRLFEEALTLRQQHYGETDARTARAARDLGMFLERQGEAAGARAGSGGGGAHRRSCFGRVGAADARRCRGACARIAHAAGGAALAARGCRLRCRSGGGVPPGPTGREKSQDSTALDQTDQQHGYGDDQQYVNIPVQRVRSYHPQ